MDFKRDTRKVIVTPPIGVGEVGNITVGKDGTRLWFDRTDEIISLILLQNLLN